MNVNRAGLREGLLASEAIVGKKNPAVLWRDGAQAVAGRRGVPGDLRMGRKAIDRRFPRGANLLRDFRIDGDDANVVHGIVLAILLFRAPAVQPFVSDCGTCARHGSIRKRRSN